MKKNNGVTLISLVVTVLILAIISSISIQVSVDVYNGTKLQNYIAKMKVIQSKVDSFVEKYGTENLEENVPELSKYSVTKRFSEDSDEIKLFKSIVSNPEDYNIDVTNSWNDELDSNIENYYYFKNNDLEILGLEDQETEVIINFKTRNIISRKSIKQDGEKYYRQYDLVGGDKLF